MVQRIYVAVDIEKTGSQLLAHKIISIGLCVGNETGEILERKRIDLQVKWFTQDDYGDFEPNCVDEFWDSRPELRPLFDHPGALPQATGILQFADWIDNLEERFPHPAYKIKFVSDNPSFDIATLDLACEIHAARRPIRYSARQYPDARGTRHQYRAIEVPWKLLDAFPEVEVNREVARIKETLTKKHDPVQDAEFIYRLYMLGLRLKSQFQ